jgi:hypothetical protein
MKKEKIIIICLIAVVILLAGFVSYKFIIENSIYNYQLKYFNMGSEYTIFQIMNQTSACVEVPITYYNTTFNIVAVPCLTSASDSEVTE